MDEPKSNLVVGLIFVAFSALLVFVWVPLDTDTGLVEKVRRQVVIGDALAPSIAGLFLFVGGALLMLVERNAPRQPALEPRKLGFMGVVVLLLIVSLLLMRYTGPALVGIVSAITQAPLEYRLLRDDFPWKYAGYFLGGGTLLVGLISLVEGRIGLRTIGIATAALIVLIVLYDLPFDDLLLPPNGDV